MALFDLPNSFGDVCLKMLVGCPIGGHKRNPTGLVADFLKFVFDRS